MKVLDTRPIRLRASLAYGVRCPGPALRHAIADMKKLLAELARADRRLLTAQLERVATGLGIAGERARAMLAGRASRADWNRAARRAA